MSLHAPPGVSGAVSAPPVSGPPPQQAPPTQPVTQSNPVSPGSEGKLNGKLASLTKHTPAKLRTYMIIALLLIATTGISGVTSMFAKQSFIDETSSESGQLSVAALDLYRALSDAEAIASSGFLAGGTESAQMREEYHTALRDASLALSRASSRAQSAEDAELIARVNAYLPVYTGLVDSARSYNRLGQPVGGTYLQQASQMMRTEMLPAAQDLQANATGAVNDSRSSATGFPWITVAAGVAALLFLLWLQVWLFKRTNRVFNKGLLGATGATVAVLAWVLTVGLLSAHHMGQSYEQGAKPLGELSEAHLAAQQARADQAMLLVTRGAGGDYLADYHRQLELLLGPDGGSGLMNRLTDDYGGDMSAPLSTARDAAEEWGTRSADVIATSEQGSYQEAVESSIGEQDDSLNTIFDQFDTAMNEATALSVDAFNDHTASAQTVLWGSHIAIAVFALLALFAAAAGIQVRIAEYHL
ncbi:hypothetical protein [Natronoglycomyces albus]|uniref:Chemotaxis methyl-accepting receptor HlyB-like 4HB MCP domain-containing protein n=1 Tax=Natronoglycomyces albus TaxID=2811108 RepID=A0A895XV24_9ACTN|nr:hypothetical protein [Natronoglycomyces albus]QSB06376.1 hypothetical protein JQS30_05550 [Natronoglycomyces albus]